MSTRDRPATEDKLETLHYQLIKAVADLATSEGWQHMIAVAARFHAYSSGGVGVFELHEYCHATRHPSVVKALGLASRNGTVRVPRRAGRGTVARSDTQAGGWALGGWSVLVWGLWEHRPP